MGEEAREEVRYAGTFDDLLALVPKLSAAQRATLTAALAASKSEDVDPSTFATVYDALRLTCERRGVRIYGPGTYRRRQGFAADCENLVRFIKKHTKPKSTYELERATRIAIGLAITGRIKDGRSVEQPDLPFVVRDLPLFLERAFPLYIQSGLLRKALLPERTNERSLV